MKQQIDQCTIDAFYANQPFFSFYERYGAFFGNGLSGIAFDGVDLRVLKGNSLLCDSDSGVDCSRLYDINECKNPSVRVANEDEPADRDHPFECDEDRQ